MDLEPRVEQAQPAQQGGEQQRGGGGKNANTHRALGEAAVGIHVLAGAGQGVEDDPPVVGERRAGAGRRGPPGAPLQQHEVNLAFQAFDGH
jgi:hypothetical protein